MSNAQKQRAWGDYLLPPQLRGMGGGLPQETAVTGDEEAETPVVQYPRDFARGGQPGRLVPTGRQPGLQQPVRLAVPYLDMTVQTGFQPASVPVPRAYSDGVCDRIVVSLGKALNSVGTPAMAVSIGGPVGWSGDPKWGGGSVAIADYYVLDQSTFTIDVQPGRWYVEVLAVFQQSQAGASILTPASVTFINRRQII
jgi:hypothetical protein